MRLKLNSLESLRGLAALSVVFYHFRVGTSFENSFFDSAWLMVDFFFVLSGFVITLAYSDRLGDMRDLSKFVKKRFLRLYPLHLLVLLAFVGLELAKFLAAKFAGFETVAQPFTGGRDLSSLTANFVLIHNFVMPNTSWNYPSWSISAEFFVYLLFASVFVAFSRKTGIRSAVLLCLMLLAFLVLQILEDGMKGQMNIAGPSRCVFSFILGHFAFLIFQRDSRRNLRFLGFITVCVSVISVMVVDRVPAWGIPLIPAFFACTIYCVVRAPAESILTRVLEFKPLVFLGTISYGIYMWHALVLYLMNIFVRKVFSYPLVEDEAGRKGIQFESVTVANGALISLLVSSIVLAWLSYRFFETRFYRSRPPVSAQSLTQR